MKTELVNDQSTTGTRPKRAVRLSRFDSSAKRNEITVRYRRRPIETHTEQSGRPILNRPDVCYKYLRRVWDRGTLDLREEFVLICLDHSLAVNGWFRLHAGGFGECTIDLLLLFGVALKTASSAIVLAHNHPSGSLIPSQEDRNATKRVATASKLLGIRLLDHLIVTRNGFYSFNERDPELFETDHLMKQFSWA